MSVENQDVDKLFFDECLIELKLEACNFEEAIIQMSQNFLKKNYVKQTFPEALIEREKEFPTGLKTNSIGIAIPHTDLKHVIKGCIGVGVLKKPVLFKAMDTKNYIEVSILFMLAVTHPSSQLKMLQQLMKIIRNEQVLLNIKDAKNKKEIMCTVRPFFGDLI